MFQLSWVMEKQRMSGIPTGALRKKLQMLARGKGNLRGSMEDIGPMSVISRLEMLFPSCPHASTSNTSIQPHAASRLATTMANVEVLGNQEVPIIKPAPTTL